VDFAGGAAVVAKHVRKAGAQVKFSTVLGKDSLKDFVLEDLKEQGIQCCHVIEHTRPTTQKSVFVQGNYRVLKVDKVDNSEISERILEKLVSSIAMSEDTDAFVFSDFRHGIFTHRTIPQLTTCLPQGPLKVADSQVASRWGNILEFQNFDLITPNEREARFALGDQDSVIRPLALKLYNQANCKILILKLGDRGIITYRAPSADVRSFFTIDSFATKVVDPLGTGDALLAYATLGLIVSKSPVIASILGSMAAAVACEHEGNIAVASEDVIEKLHAIEERLQLA
jgi:bifunctional ADP-heptose synthase (sugar kinase/adenylyltransferase)